MSVVGVHLPVAEDVKVLGVVLDRRLTFQKHLNGWSHSIEAHLSQSWLASQCAL